MLQQHQDLLVARERDVVLNLGRHFAQLDAKLIERDGLLLV